MQHLRTQFGLQHTLDRLEIIGQICPVDIRFLLQSYDRTHLPVLGLIHHHEGLRDLAFIQRVDLLGNLRCQVLVLKPTASGVRVDHQSGIHHRVLIF